MSKKLDVTGITNELSEGSAFFRPSSPPREKQVPSPAAREPEERAETGNEEPVRPVPPVRGVPPVPSSRVEKRYMKQRHPFDIYHDQYDALKELALEDRKLGGVGSMSREAIDKFIAEKKGRR